MGSKLWFDYSFVTNEATATGSEFDAITIDLMREIDRMMAPSRRAIGSAGTDKMASDKVSGDKNNDSSNGTEETRLKRQQLRFDVNWLSANGIRLKKSFGCDEIDELCADELLSLKYSARIEIMFVEFLIAHVTEDTASALRLLKHIDSCGRR